MSDPLRDLAENTISACLPFLPLEGSWDSGYTVARRVGSEVRALPEEWAEAALAIAELHKALAIEPEYEWEVRAEDGELIQHADSDEDARKRVGWFRKSYAQRRIKAGPWERVEG